MKTTEHDPSGGGLIGKTNDFPDNRLRRASHNHQKGPYESRKHALAGAAADNIQAQADYLVRHPVPSGFKGIIFTDRAGNWLPIANAGYMVYWCNTGQIPVGALGMRRTDATHERGRFRTDLLGNPACLDKRLVVD